MQISFIEAARRPEAYTLILEKKTPLQTAHLLHSFFSFIYKSVYSKINKNDFYVKISRKFISFKSSTCSAQIINKFPAFLCNINKFRRYGTKF